MDVSLVIRRRLLELGLEQKDLARAARVTESYVSQLLTRKRRARITGRRRGRSRMRLRFKGRLPTALYYYREPQNMRDPLHFRSP